MISRLPAGRGHDAAQEVFVGRTLDGQVNAMAWSRGAAAGIEITLQFSNVVVAYLTRSGCSCAPCARELRLC